MGFVNYYKARKRYYSMLIYIKIYSEKKNVEELNNLSEEFHKQKELVIEDELPLFERILDIEDMLLNCDEEQFKIQFENKLGEYYQALIEREELYKNIFEKTQVINILYSIDRIRPILIKGKLDQPYEIENPDILEPLLNYIGINVISNGNQLIPAERNMYEIMISAPYKYLVRLDKKEYVKSILDEIDRIQSKLQLEIALRQIEDPDKDREEDFVKNQEYYLELRKKIDKYDLTYLIEQVRTVFKLNRIDNQ